MSFAGTLRSPSKEDMNSPARAAVVAANKKCIPCEGGQLPPFTEEQAEQVCTPTLHYTDTATAPTAKSVLRSADRNADACAKPHLLTLPLSVVHAALQASKELPLWVVKHSSDGKLQLSRSFIAKNFVAAANFFNEVLVHRHTTVCAYDTRLWCVQIDCAALRRPL